MGCAIVLVLAGAVVRAQLSSGEPARIECGAEAAQVGAVCSVDTPVYVGWRVFHAQCASCHAQDAVGSSFAPGLTRRISEMDARAFFRALDDGYLGPHDPSPPRGANPDVARYYEELWSYLSARARGDLPAGPLARLPNGPAALE
jgi:hypothetical protein